jgi:AcrR family transcriptional regulator
MNATIKPFHGWKSQIYLAIDTKMTSETVNRGRPRGFDRQQVLRQAMEVFWEKGFERASMAELTAAMGLKPPSVYAAFGDKENLFREAVALYMETDGSGIWDQLELASTAREAIHNLLRSTAKAYSRHVPSRGCLIVLAAPQQEGASPAVCEELKQRRLTNTVLLEQRLRRGGREGELPAGLNCRAVASYYASVQHGMSILARDGANRKTLMGVADSAMAGWDALIAANTAA